MPEYLSPGVYVEEIDAGPKPIEGVSTSTCGAVGVTARGPTSGKPVLVTSFADFVRTFGGFLPDPDPALLNKWALDDAEGARWWLFPLAVKGFFDNGGQRLYVKRVFSSSAVASSRTLGHGVVAEVEQDAAATSDQVQLRHLIGVKVGTTLHLLQNGLDIDSSSAVFAVQSYDAVSRTVKLDRALGKPLKASGGLAIVRTVTGPTNSADRTLQFTAASLGRWGDDVSVRVRPVVAATFNLLADPGTGGTAFTAQVKAAANTGDTVITVDDNSGFTAGASGDRVLIANQEFTVTAKSASSAATVTITISSPGAPAPLAIGTQVRRLRPANVTGTPKITVWGAAQLYEGAIVELDSGVAKDVTTILTISGNTVTLSANVSTQYVEGAKLRVVEAEVAVRYAPDGVVAALEVFSPVRLVDDGTPSYLVTQVNARSRFVKVGKDAGFSSSDLAFFPIGANGTWDSLGSGADGLSGLKVEDFVGVDGGSGARTGIQALEDIQEISIALAPCVWSQTVRSALITHCESLRYRFAIIDPQDGLSIEEIRAVREPIDTKYAALYYPWIEVRDPSVSRDVDVAPSGHLAGIYARVDVERGVHKAPANEVIRSISKISQDVTKREQDVLNPKGINALRFFPGRGNRVWGARTVSSDASWKYINVRRLFIFVEASIDYGTQWVVFEPNDEPLWARVRQTITNFLTTVWRSGALQGSTAAEAFFVKADHTTMTQDDIDNGRLIVQIGIAPVKPAEFVIFRIQQKTLDASDN